MPGLREDVAAYEELVAQGDHLCAVLKQLADLGEEASRYRGIATRVGIQAEAAAVRQVTRVILAVIVGQVGRERGRHLVDKAQVHVRLGDGQ